MRDVPGNGLAFPVRVGRQVDVFSVFGCLFELGDDLLFRFDHLVGGFKIVLNINAKLALREIHDMSHRSPHIEIGSEIFLDGFDFRG